MTDRAIVEEADGGEGEYLLIKRRGKETLKCIVEDADNTGLCLNLIFEEHGVREKLNLRMGHANYQLLREKLSDQRHIQVKTKNSQSVSSAVNARAKGSVNLSKRGKNAREIGKSQIKSKRGQKDSVQPIYRRMKEKVKNSAEAFSKQELAVLKAKNVENDEEAGLEWGVYAKVRVGNQIVRFEAKSQTKIEENETKSVHLFASDDLTKQISEMTSEAREGGEGEAELSSQAGGEDETRVGSETGELRSKKGQKSAQQPPPAIAVTPQNKIRAPYNNNNAKPKPKRLMASDDDENWEVGPGFSGSAPPKKKARKMTTSTPKPSFALVKSKRGGRSARGGNKGIRGGHGIKRGGRGAPKKGGDNIGRGSGLAISVPSDKGECSGLKTKRASPRPLISDISNDEEESNVNKSFMNNSPEDTESSNSSDFGELLKPKKRRTHK